MNKDNKRRVLTARAALALSAELTELTENNEPIRWEDDRMAVVVDLLTNLRHYCDHTGLDFDEALRTANGHYMVEREDETTPG